MLPKRFILFALFAVAPLAFADEKLAVLKAGNDVYTNVTVLNVSTTDVYFTYAQGRGLGMANVKLKNLDPALQKHFHFNATNAVAVEAKQSQANVQYQVALASRPAPPPPNEGRDAPPAAGRPADVLWRMDLPGALSQARSENKLVLLDFTGSDWCGWCMKFDSEVLSTSQFASYANAGLILVKLDFPNHTPQSADLRHTNQTLYDQFHVSGFPTFILVNSDGKELGRQVGYLEGGPRAFISELESFGKR